MTDRYVPETMLDKKFKKFITNGLYLLDNNLEKAIYLYIRLCQIFSYNNEYYIFDGASIVATKHETINNIPKYNTVNNQIICYEFTAIYAKLLDELGIEFKVKYKNQIDHFGGQHTNLTFYYDKFTIYTDSVTSILDGDLFLSKIGLDLVGIMCKNEDEKIQKEFRDVLDKVYTKLNDKSYLKYFYSLKEKLDGLSLEEKIKYFVGLSNMFFSTCMEKLSLMLYLRKILLTINDAVDMLIVKNNSNELKYKNVYSNQLAFPTMIIIIDSNPYLFIPGNNLVKVSVEELQEMFNNYTLEYKVDNPKRLALIK